MPEGEERERASSFAYAKIAHEAKKTFPDDMTMNDVLEILAQMMASATEAYLAVAPKVPPASVIGRVSQSFDLSYRSYMHQILNNKHTVVHKN